MLLTVAICTYNRATLLRECLQSLALQSVSSDDYLIMVVDNNSTDNTREVCDEMAGEFPHFEYFFEANQGLSIARNSAWRHINTPWIAYFDDDALACPKWIETVFKTINEQTFDCFGGPFYPWYRDGRADWFLDEYASNYELFKYQEVTELKKEHVAGCNMVFRTEVLEKIGGFSEKIGMTGSVVAYGEETQVQNKLREAGMTVGYIPELKIQHYIQPSRQTIQWQLQRAWAEGRDSWDAELEERSFYNLIKFSLKAPLGILKVFIITLNLMLKRSAGFKNLFLNVSSKTLYYFARIVYWFER